VNVREINEKMKFLVKTERKITLEVLHLINLAEDLDVHLELAYSSLHDWLIKEHKYSDRAANRRIQVAKLLRAVPAISDKIERGSLNLTTLSKAQSIIRTQEKMSGKPVSVQQKLEAIASIENQSTLKAEQMLMSLFPETASQVRQDHVTVIDAFTQRLGINLSNESMEDLNRAKEILSHKIPSGKASEVIAHILREFVERMDPLTQKTGAALAHRINRRQVIQRARGSCSFRDPLTGRICGARFRIERDHIIPRALGGDNSPANARALCRKHNQFMARKILGKAMADRWRSDSTSPIPNDSSAPLW
jgi:hypothetical protein